MASARFDPKQEMKAMGYLYRRPYLALLWYATLRGRFRYRPRIPATGFSFCNQMPRWSRSRRDFRYYTRHINSVMLPIVWQPHINAAPPLCVYLEAAATFSYQLRLSDYEDERQGIGNGRLEGDYNKRRPATAAGAAGLAGGGGIAFLIRRFEINVRACYYFSDVVRNRNRYVDNGIDGSENPFWTTPMRSPLDNLTISGGVELPLQQRGLRPGNRVPNAKRTAKSSNTDYKYSSHGNHTTAKKSPNRYRRTWPRSSRRRGPASSAGARSSRSRPYGLRPISAMPRSTSASSPLTGVPRR